MITTGVVVLGATALISNLDVTFGRMITPQSTSEPYLSIEAVDAGRRPIEDESAGLPERGRPGGCSTIRSGEMINGISR
jgi:hypothetical protein